MTTTAEPTGILTSSDGHEARLVATGTPLAAVVRPYSNVGGWLATVTDQRTGDVVDHQHVNGRRDQLDVATRLVAAALRERVSLYPTCEGTGDLCGAPAGIECEPGCPSRAAVRTISRAEYERDLQHGYAGPVSTLYPSTVATWTATAVGWTGEHWAMWLEPGEGTVLGPINVRD